MALGFANGSATVTTTASVALTVNPGVPTILQNTSSAAVFLGGPSVTTSGANIGYSLATNAPLTLPPAADGPQSLYAIIASGTGTLVWLVGAS
jgi:hypothetical protein